MIPDEAQESTFEPQLARLHPEGTSPHLVLPKDEFGAMDSISELTERIKKFRDEREWAQFHNHKDMALSLVLEAAELLEHFQWKSSEEVAAHAKTHKGEIGEELADVAMYLFELADNLGIDLLKVIDDKLTKNAAKYPVEKARGIAKKYTSL